MKFPERLNFTWEECGPIVYAVLILIVLVLVLYAIDAAPIHPVVKFIITIGLWGAMIKLLWVRKEAIS